METPKAEIIKFNPDCQGTHVIQAELDELSKKADRSDYLNEQLNEAAKRIVCLEKEKDEILMFFTRAFKFVEHLEHRDKCQAGTIPCLNCEAGHLAEDWRVR